ncbi:DUF1156 domain-containing protein [Paenibacillus sp. FSL M8-0142]|uniref:DUF1156 domain-containing protein n=1 Tax=Paenibacillus sp. FSL M8-0142 TaxID=2954525 RepID=UPI003159BF87
MSSIKIPKKLIEVAIPLEDINIAAAREKSIRHGHPSSIHLWWARRPISVARAILFAQLVNDPGYERHLQRGMNKEAAKKERERLFNIIRKLVVWENSNNEELLKEAYEEIKKSWKETCELNKGVPGFDPDILPAFHDPFAGGGAIPLEAQRLGLESYASDLNPVSVMINKAMIEIPTRFSGQHPINPDYGGGLVSLVEDCKGAKGIAEDVRYYGAWIREESIRRIGHLHPEVQLPEAHGGGKATVIAWIWARTVKSPNPAYNHIEIPLVRSFKLANRKGLTYWIEPIISEDKMSYKFIVRDSGTPQLEGTVNRNGGVCLLSGTSVPFQYIRQEAKAGRMGTKLMAVVAEGKKGRVYLSPTPQLESIARVSIPENVPSTEMPDKAIGFRVQEYGMKRHSELYTPRQLVVLATLSDLVQEVHGRILQDAIKSGMKNDELPFENGGTGSRAYADAICAYLAFQIDQLSNHLSTLCAWHVNNEQLKNTFSRQTLAMTWDFAETNPFSTSTGSLYNLQERQVKGIASLTSTTQGFSLQLDASKQNLSVNKVISTDPPYYDNIGYADLSDYFYVWMRRSLKPFFPSIFATLLVPKEEELIATPFRHGNKKKAEEFFLSGMTQVMRNLSFSSHKAFPITIYYAFKSSETKDNGVFSAGWATFLEAVFNAGLVITGTWPVRTEQTSAIKQNLNVLSSSIVLVCRPREETAPSISRREFIRELNTVLPSALNEMVNGSIEYLPVSAVDLQQAAIGPGMSVFSKYSSVIEADGSSMSVKTALQLINRSVDVYLNSSEGDMDSDTLFCLTWFEQYGWQSSNYGQAELLANAKGTTVDGLKNTGVLESGQGVVRLLKWAEYPVDWHPVRDNHTPIWEALHHLIRTLQQQGEQATGILLAGMPVLSNAIRNLAYRLYTLCERKGWADDARVYNELIASWDGIDTAAIEFGHHGSQLELF